MNWLWVGGVSLLVYTSMFGVCLARGRWSWGGLGVGLANMVIVILHLVAPIRGWADPDYLGYSLGLIRVEQGPMVTLVAGGILLAALTSACVAALGGRGHAMLLVAFFDGATAAYFGLMLVAAFCLDPDGLTIQLGEYLTIPPVPTVAIIGLLFVAPLAAASRWALRRSLPTVRAADASSPNSVHVE